MEIKRFDEFVNEGVLHNQEVDNLRKLSNNMLKYIYDLLVSKGYDPEEAIDLEREDQEDGLCVIVRDKVAEPDGKPYAEYRNINSIVFFNSNSMTCLDDEGVEVDDELLPVDSLLDIYDYINTNL